MVMAIFLKWGPFRCNGGEVKVVLGREGCEDHVEPPHVRVALQFHICFMYVFTCPPLPHFYSPQICGNGDGHFLEAEPFQVQWGGS